MEYFTIFVTFHSSFLALLSTIRLAKAFSNSRIFKNVRVGELAIPLCAVWAVDYIHKKQLLVTLDVIVLAIAKVFD
jgi:hypothetical protein